MTETIRLKNIVKLFLLIISVWLVATVLPYTFADNINEPVYSAQDDSGETPVAHLEERLISLEIARRALNAEINELNSNSAAFEHALERLAELDSEMASIHAEMNQIWNAFDSAFDLDDFEFEPGDDVIDDEADDDFTEWEYLNYLEIIPYEPFEPIYEEAPMRMSDAEIEAFAAVPLVEPTVITGANIAQFLDGTLGTNDGHFVINGPITAPTTRVAGRPGIFTGVIEGNGHTITGLRLGAGAGTNGVGFVQSAGDGAVIRNLNFTNTATTDAARAVDFNAAATSANSRGVGMVIGQTTGTNAVITLDNVHLTGNIMQMTLRSAGDNFSSWGGMVGRVGADTTLNMRGVSVGNVSFHASNATGRLDVAGGLVGSVHGGRVNITSITGENRINVDMRGESRGTTSGTGASGGAGVNSGIRRGGGVVGYVFSGHVAIYDTVVVTTRMALQTGLTGAAAARNGSMLDPMRVLGTAGGMVGGLNTAGTVRLNNVENQALMQVQWAGGDGRTQGTAPAAPAGRIGGLIGHAAGTVHITNSRNYGVLQHQGNNAMAGGLIGYTGPSSIVVITDSHNGASTARPGQLLPTGTHVALPGQIFHRNSNATNPGTHNISTWSVIGGIVGRSRGRMTIENTENFANIHSHLVTGGGANGGRGRANTRIGGIVGRANAANGQVFALTNVTNHGTISTPIRGGYLSGIMGELLAPARGRAGAITLTNVTNETTGTITGGINQGGILARSRPANVTIRNAVNRANLVRTGTTTAQRPANSGGIVGFAGGASLRIETARNYGNIVGNGTAAVTNANRGAERAGGIIGRSGGRWLMINDVYNRGDVRGNQDAGGIAGLISGRDATVNFAINHGNVMATRGRSRTIAGGIVAHSSGRNILIRNAGNFGNVTAPGGNNNMDGVAGILGRTRAAAARVEISFNQGTISGRNSAGGIVGRNQGALNITDVYNIGAVHGANATGQNARAGNGILGRRRTGTVRITRGWVSARVGGYAVGTAQAGTRVQRVDNRQITGITFSGIFVDETAFVFTGSGYGANPAIQSNRNGIFAVDTELLTSGYLPGFSGGPWRIGIQGVSYEHQRTYPYFWWQIPTNENETGNDLQEPFFTFIRWDDPNPAAAQLDEDIPCSSSEDVDYSLEDVNTDYPSEDEGQIDNEELDNESDEQQIEELLELLDVEPLLELLESKELIEPVETSDLFEILELIELLEEVELVEMVEVEEVELIEIAELIDLLIAVDLIEVLSEDELEPIDLVKIDELLELLEETELIELVELDEPTVEESNDQEDLDYSIEDDESFDDENYSDEEVESTEDEDYLTEEIEPIGDETCPVELNRRRPVMDLELPAGTHRIDFDFRCDFSGDFYHWYFPHCVPTSQPNTRVFNTYVPNGFTPVPAGVATHFINLPRTGYTSIGLISSNGVVGFEARDVVGRIIIRGYDPLFGSDPNYYIDHARFEIVSDNAATVHLNRIFMECLQSGITDMSLCPLPDRVDTMRGLGVITFETDPDCPTHITDEGISFRDTGGERPSQVYDGPNRSNETEANSSNILENYTVVRITALGYRPAYRILYIQDLNLLSSGVISVPLERIPFAIRVWVPQEAQYDNEIEEPDSDYVPAREPSPPGAVAASPTPIGARPGFGMIPSTNPPTASGGTLCTSANPYCYINEPGSHLANYPVLTHTRFPANNANFPHGPTTRTYEAGHTVESGGPGVRGHFAMQYVMWGDTLDATARLHTTNTIEELRFEYLIDREVSSWTTADEERVRILDLDMYVTNLALPLMYFRFVEITGFDADGEPIMRPLDVVADNSTLIDPMPNIELTIHTGTDPVVTPVRHTARPVDAPNNSLVVHAPRAADPGQMADSSEDPALPFRAPLQQEENWTANFQHFRVDGMSEAATFSVVDTTEAFVSRPDLAVIDYLEWFYPLYITVNPDTDNERDERLVFTNMTAGGTNTANVNAQAQRDEQYEASFEGDPILIRTLVIPLVRLREVEVRVVERVETAPGVFEYELITHSTVDHNGNALPGNPANTGRFLMIDEGMNILYAEAEGFYSYQLNASDIDYLLTITSGNYIRIVLEPRFLEVTFDLQGGVDEADFPYQIIRHGLTADEPLTNPTREGNILDYDFDGWFTAPEGGELFDFDTPITEDITLYARWTARHQVDFDLQGGVDEADFPDQQIRHEDTAIEPETNPTREGYRFVNWYDAPTGGEEFDFENTPITDDTTVYARWIPVAPFEFIKVNHLYDELDNANFARLEGAIFNLYIWDYIEAVCEPDGEEEDCENDDGEYGWVLLHEDVESDENGLVEFPLLDAGRRYRLVETEAPEGFRLPEGHWYIEIEANTDRTITITRSLDEYEDEFEDVPFNYGFVPCQEDLDDCEPGYAWFVGNMRSGMPFSFTKTNDYLYLDADSSDPTVIPSHPNLLRLPGARFTLSRWEFDLVSEGYGWVIIEEDVISGADGLVEFENLLTLDGRYRLDETQAPSEFRLPHGWWVIEWNDETERFVITADGTVSLVPAFRYVVCSVDNLSLLDKCLEEGEVVYFVGNFPETILPSTGGIGAMTLTLIGALGLAFVALLYVRGKTVDDLAKIDELIS